ncbi:MAG: thiamine transport system permease protein [Halobacteriales archaeon]
MSSESDGDGEEPGPMRRRKRNGPAVAERWLERHGLELASVATALVVLVVFYFPVGLVLREAVVSRGRLTLAPVADVLLDPFYTGALADVLANPLAVGHHLGAVWGYVTGVRIIVRPLVVLGSVTPLPWPHLVMPSARLGLIGFTGYQATLSTILSVLLGLPGAWILSRFSFRGRRFLRSLTILPFVLPGIMVAIGFVAMFGTNGTLNDVLRAVGLPTIDILFSLKIVLLAHAFYNAPLVTRVTTAAWESVDARAVETARSLGASPLRAFRDVIVPQLLPAILTGALLTFVFTFMTFPIVLALGGLQLATVEVWVYRRVQQLELAEAAALAVVETTVSLVLTYAYLRYEARQAELGAGTPPERDPLVPSLRSFLTGRRLAIVGYGVVVLVVFVGPLASMVIESVSGGGGFTLRWYRFLIERQTTGAGFQTKPLPAVRNSLLFAAGTVAVAVPMGVTISVVTQRHRWGRFWQSMAMAPLAVSGIISGIGLLQLVFGVPLPGPFRIPLPDPVAITLVIHPPERLQLTGPVAIVAAHAVAAYPFVVRNVSPLLARVDRATVESARSLGATRARALLDVELPLVASGVVAGAAFAVAISIGEFNSTVILAEGTTSYTMPVAVERYLGSRTLGPASAMGTVMLLVTAASFVVIDRLGGHFERERGRGGM